ncbi:MAG: CoA transferase [Cryobacterium sp.]|nr:CoA transferase [Cryobacterium sp.]
MHAESDETVWRPLHGVKVLDLTTMLPGPFASQILVDLGATVIKVERSPGGDAMRHIQPHMFESFNRGKSSIALDLKNPADVEVLLSLAAEADVFMEGFRPGVLERLGVGFAAISAKQPKVVYVSLSGWGQSGPLVNDPGHNGTFMARSGATFLTGEPSSPPGDAPVPVGDLGASLYAVIGILAALRDPHRTARQLDVSLFGSVLSFMTPRLAEYIGSEATSREDVMLRPANGVFAVADGYVLIAAVEDHFWGPLCRALGLDDLAADGELARYELRKARASELNERISRAVADRGRDELVDLLRAHDVPVSPVLSPVEVMSDAQVIHLGRLASDRPVRSFVPIDGVKLVEAGDTEPLDASGPAIRAEGWSARAANPFPSDAG